MHGSFILAFFLMSTPITESDSTPGGPCASQPSTCDAAAIAEFTEKVSEYVLIRDEAARGLPRDRLFDDAREMLALRKALRQAIRHARPNARAGDLFTPSAGSAFRHIIAVTAAAHRVAANEFVRELRDERLPGARHPVVNGAYDWRLGAWMWPALLQALPSLPTDLQYRIVDGDLVLIDVRAGLVVDVLNDAMEGDED